MFVTRVPHKLIMAGGTFTVIGVLSSFELERHSFHSTNDVLFQILSIVFLPALFLGLLLLLIGALAWTWRVAPERSFGAGGAILFCLIFGAFVPINIHDWTAVLMFVFVTGVLIVAILLIGAFLKWVYGQNETER